jgi:hypothetical protein
VLTLDVVGRVTEGKTPVARGLGGAPPCERMEVRRPLRADEVRPHPVPDNQDDTLCMRHFA